MTPDSSANLNWRFEYCINHWGSFLTLQPLSFGLGRPGVGTQSLYYKSLEAAGSMTSDPVLLDYGAFPLRPKTEELCVCYYLEAFGMKSLQSYG